MITDERAEKAVEFIRDHAEIVGQLRGAVEQTKHHAKVKEKVAYLEATGTVAEREARAGIDPDVVKAWEDHAASIADYEIERTQLRAAELTIEVWRSQSANQRRGNI